MLTACKANDDWAVCRPACAGGLDPGQDPPSGLLRECGLIGACAPNIESVRV